MTKIKDLLNKIRFWWANFISNIKSFFLGNTNKSSADGQYADDIEKVHDENTLESNHEEVQPDALEVKNAEVRLDALEVKHEEVQPDAPASTHEEIQPDAPTSNHKEVQPDAPASTHEEVEPDAPTSTHQEVQRNALESKHEEVQPDAPASTHQEVQHNALKKLDNTNKDFDKQQSKEYEKSKCYSLQGALQEKTEFDHSTQTLALAFQISEIELGNCNTNLSNLKLLKINKIDCGYALLLEDKQKNLIKLYSQYLNMYFPTYFEKHRGKKTCAELFSPKENGISNDMIIPLVVPKEVDIFFGKFDWRNPIKKMIQSRIPDLPTGVYLKHCEDHLNFYLNSDNIISLSIESLKTKAAALASDTPFKTEWPIKDVLVQGGFANTFNNYLNPQPAKGEASAGFKAPESQVRDSAISQHEREYAVSK